MWWIVTCFVSCALTWLEIDQTLYVPSLVKKRVFIRTCVWIFIGINGLLSIGLYFILVDNQALASFNNSFKSILLGLAYPALARIKFTTLKINDKEISVGLDLVYESIKNSFYKRIRRVVRDAEYEEVVEYAQKNTLEYLQNYARFSIDRNLSMSAAQKENDLNWCKRLEDDNDATEANKKMYLADFILSGRRR